jgi:iron complex transport system ATP-binding protein
MKTKGLTKRYGARTVVDGVDIEFPRGKVTSMIGPNGAGKSTVMGMVSRLIERDAGSVELEGRDLAQWKSKQLARRLAILTQSNNTDMKLTVRELVALGRFPYSANHLTPEDEEHVERALSYMDLEPIQDSYIDELSGGQRQRAFIAMVIAQDTGYVLLDEPTNNLDITYASALMRTARKLCDELGKTVILVLHELNYAAFYSDFICALKDGRVHTFGTVEEVMTKETLKEIYGVDFEIIRVRGKPLALYY